MLHKEKIPQFSSIMYKACDKYSFPRKLPPTSMNSPFQHKELPPFHGKQTKKGTKMTAQERITWSTAAHPAPAWLLTPRKREEIWEWVPLNGKWAQAQQAEAWLTQQHCLGV